MDRQQALKRFRAAWTAYKDHGGDREAAALSYFGFFALFPSLLLAVAVLGFVLRTDASADVQQTVLEGVGAVLPGSEAMLAESLDAIARRAGTIGLVGLLGVAWSGIGAIGTLRTALDRIFGAESVPGLKGKARDLRFAVVTGLVLLASISLGTVAAGGAGGLLAALGIPGGAVRVTGMIAAGLLALGADVLLFLLVYSTLPAHHRSWRDVLGGAVLAAVGWWLLRNVGGWYIGRSAERASAAYGVAATTVGLLLAINLASRLTLFGAAFASTSGGRERTGPAPVPVPPTPAPTVRWVAAAVALAGLSRSRSRA